MHLLRHSSTARRTMSHTLGSASPAAAKGLGPLGAATPGARHRASLDSPGRQTRGRRPLGPIQALIGGGACQMGFGCASHGTWTQAIRARAFILWPLERGNCFVKPSTSLSRLCWVLTGDGILPVLRLEKLGCPVCQLPGTVLGGRGRCLKPKGCGAAIRAEVPAQNLI